MPDGFSEQVVLVTGGSRGIGRATAVLLGEAGARVAITYKSRKAEADSLVEQLSHAGHEAMAVQADFVGTADVVTSQGRWIPLTRCGPV